MQLSFYFDIYPWTKQSDAIYASTLVERKQASATRYRIDITVDDPAQPDKIISATPTKVTES